LGVLNKPGNAKIQGLNLAGLFLQCVGKDNHVRAGFLTAEKVPLTLPAGGAVFRYNAVFYNT
jgi:hypothetical protein